MQKVEIIVAFGSDLTYTFGELTRVDTFACVPSRRNFEGDQRVVEGLEVVKTFRVLDGVAGTEYPTSSIRSQLRLTRPQGDESDIPSEAF